MIQRFPFRVFAAALVEAGGGRHAQEAEVWASAPGPLAPKCVHWKGTLLIFALYALSVAMFWKFCVI